LRVGLSNIRRKARKQGKRTSFESAEAIRPVLKKTILSVLEGFRAASGMVGAIRSGACDGIGIGRPLGAEPYLCKEILEGKVNGAIGDFVPLPKNTQATGSQLHRFGLRDKLISDWSDEEEVKRWLDANRLEEERKMAILPVVDSSRYSRIKAQSGFKYVRPRA
jgi:hypothetical protein